MSHLQFKTKPFQHQLEVLEKTKDLEFHALFWEMGLGKTKSALDLAAYLYNCNKIKQVLFITKNGVDQQTIEEEIPIHLPLLEKQFIADYWRDSERKWPLYRKNQKFLGDKLAILAINCEALGTLTGSTLCHKLALQGPTLLVVDESQEFSGNKSVRTKNLLSYKAKFPFRRIMTGTPTGGNPLHMYPQMHILSNEIFPKSIESFEWRYCKKEKGKMVWVKDKKTGKARKKSFFETTGYKNLDELERIIAPFVSRKTKDECLDLPPKIYRQEPFALSPEERELYEKIRKQTLAEVAPGQFVDTTMAITKLIRLQQVTCGFVAFEDLVTGKRAQSLLPTCSRLKSLQRYVEQLHGKGLIWATFTTSIDQIIDMLRKGFDDACIVRYDGTVSDKHKQENKLRFKSDPQVKFLVGHPKAGGVGLNLPEASNVCYYSNDYHLISRLQSEDRAHRIGSKNSVTYTDLFAIDTVDFKIIKALKEKFDIASQLTGDELREWIK